LETPRDFFSQASEKSWRSSPSLGKTPGEIFQCLEKRLKIFPILGRRTEKGATEKQYRAAVTRLRLFLSLIFPPTVHRRAAA
jgi:hypothetical protein